MKRLSYYSLADFTTKISIKTSEISWIIILPLNVIIDQSIQSNFENNRVKWIIMNEKFSFVL